MNSFTKAIDVFYWYLIRSISNQIKLGKIKSKLIELMKSTKLIVYEFNSNFKSTIQTATLFYLSINEINSKSFFEL